MGLFVFIAAVVLLGEWAVKQLARDIRDDYRRRVKHGSGKKATKKPGKRGGKAKAGKPAKSTTFGIKAAAATGAVVHGGWLASKGVVQGWRAEWPEAKRRARERWERKHTPPEAETPPPADPAVTVEPAPEQPHIPTRQPQPWPNSTLPTQPPTGLNLSKPQQNGDTMPPTSADGQSYEQVKAALKQIVADAGAEMDDAKAADARLNAEIAARGQLADRLAAIKIDPEVVKNVAALRDSAGGWQQTAKARVAAAERDLSTAQAALKSFENSAQARFFTN